MVGREGTRALSRELERPRALAACATSRSSSTRTGHSGWSPLAIQQRTEIGRALARDARVFLFDEPNSALTAEESSDLFRRMHVLADAGTVVLLVSPSDRASWPSMPIAWRSSSTACAPPSSRATALTQDGIARGLVVGQAAREPQEQLVVRPRRATPRTAVRAHGLDAHRAASSRASTSTSRAGEIVAFVGVEGSGARELVRSIAGFEREHRARSRSRGRDGAASVASRHEPRVRRIARRACSRNLTIGDNMVSRLGDEITSRGGALRRGRMRSIAHRAARAVPGQGARPSTRRSAPCRAATSRRWPSRRRSSTRPEVARARGADARGRRRLQARDLPPDARVRATRATP